jgi:hypothetical protein
MVDLIERSEKSTSSWEGSNGGCSVTKEQIGERTARVHNFIIVLQSSEAIWMEYFVLPGNCEPIEIACSLFLLSSGI